jgi:predicted NBD/HSP70 family sugar kinase
MARKKAAATPEATATLPIHGALSLPAVDVDSYSLEVEDDEGFAGDKANKGAFSRILDELRQPLAELGEDPLGDKPTAKVSRKKLAAMLTEGEPEETALVQGAIEQFAQQLAAVIRRFVKLKSWREVQAIAVGGGFRASRVGEVAIARAAMLLQADGPEVQIRRIHHAPDEAGLIGCAYLLPTWMISGHDAILAADIGGTNIRAGIVELQLPKGGTDLSKASVAALQHWCHRDGGQLSREELVDHLAEMFRSLLSEAKTKRLRLAPLIGIGCPGIIREDGSIERGAHNLPGHWESAHFNLPASVRERIPQVAEHDTTVVLHNDAVVQGLSEIPYMREFSRWAVLTIGTGLGNAVFINRRKPEAV